MIVNSPDDRATAPSDLAAVSELFELHRSPTARLAYVLTRNSEISDEIVQEAFLKLLANWDRVENPTAYLRTAVVNACHSHHRHLRVVRDAPVGVVEHSRLHADEISDAVAKLPFPQRAVLALRYFCDLDDIEIARVLGIRRATVRTRAHRALNQLRKEIAP